MCPRKRLVSEADVQWQELAPQDPDTLDEPSRKEALRMFSDHVWAFYRARGRAFPWRETDDPYRILLSELMLQQTQTERVLPKYELFLQQWPTLQAMAGASTLELLASWRGLGYNRRALALRTIARMSEQYGWTLPADVQVLRSMPMVGPATSAAILSFAYHQKALYLETNIRRVLIHHFHPDQDAVKDKALHEDLAQLLELQDDCKHWYYALMDYGVFLKKVLVNPNRRSAHYVRQGTFKNSDRQLRGMLLLLFTEQGPLDMAALQGALPFEPERIERCLASLEDEGFIMGVSEQGSVRYGIRSE